MPALRRHDSEPESRARALTETPWPGPPRLPNAALPTKPKAYKPKDPYDRTRYQCIEAKNPEKYPNYVVTFAYLAQGAANAVFQIQPYTGQVGLSYRFVDNIDRTNVPNTMFSNRLLRVSKGIPKTLSFAEVNRGYETMIKPLFAGASSTSVEDKASSNGNGTSNGHLANGSPQTTAPSYEEHLMEAEGVSFDDTIARYLHSLMKDHDDKCALGPCDKVPHMESRGILLPDMSSVPGSSLMIELKPKWLAQSPTAPRDSFKCRTCALQARRASNGKAQPLSYICPLHLVAGNEQEISRFLRPHVFRHFMVNSSNPAINIDHDIESILARATSYLATGPGHALLAHMRALQMSHDVSGPPDPAVPLPSNRTFKRLRVAMTLRDCSMFVNIPYAKDKPIEAKLADLDFKSMEKLMDWAGKERALKNGGWYTQVDKESRCQIAGAWKDCPWWV
ncbi:hypothetical protein CC80DRAFT_425023 [Byssothecium circinans]|uniref:Inositol-pentakisphosphate 2-kinase n=1 Tax=Byssothecium circinans TaxID=147558 RepID=A0A6A5TEU1_9PLEO|nr:hypothetical protein CC80DRAFT_425023 [Byssothecium circinans]